MATARDVILSARDRHPAFSPRVTPDPVLRRFLEDYQDQLLGEIAELQADAVHASETFTLPLTDFAAGHTITTPYFRLHGGHVVPRNSDRPPVPLQLVAYVDRLDRGRWPSAYDRAGTLFLLGEADDWTDYSSVVLDLFPSAAVLPTLDTDFVLPGKKAKSALVEATAALMADRSDGVDSTPFHARAGAAESAYLDEVSGRRRARVSQIRSVW